MKKDALQRLVRVVLNELHEDSNHSDDGYIDAGQLSQLSKLFNNIVKINDQIKKYRRANRNEDVLNDYKNQISIDIENIKDLINKINLK
jgi:uncharacterized protein (UPF0332 family)